MIALNLEKVINIAIELQEYDLQFQHYPRTSMEQLRNNECNQSKIPFGQKCDSGWEFLTENGWVHDRNLIFKHQGKNKIIFFLQVKDSPFFIQIRQI